MDAQTIANIVTCRLPSWSCQHVSSCLPVLQMVPTDGQTTWWCQWPIILC